MWLCRRSESTEHNSAVINMQLIKFINSLKIFEKDIPWCYNLQKQKRLPDTNEGMSFCYNVCSDELINIQWREYIC